MLPQYFIAITTVHFKSNLVLNRTMKWNKSLYLYRHSHFFDACHIYEIFLQKFQSTTVHSETKSSYSCVKDSLFQLVCKISALFGSERHLLEQDGLFKRKQATPQMTNLSILTLLTYRQQMLIDDIYPLLP
jgi:Zn-dependent M32 family carboxypeptidase